MDENLRQKARPLGSSSNAGGVYGNCHDRRQGLLRADHGSRGIFVATVFRGTMRPNSRARSGCRHLRGLVGGQRCALLARLADQRGQNRLQVDLAMDEAGFAKARELKERFQTGTARRIRDRTRHYRDGVDRRDRSRSRERRPGRVESGGGVTLT